MLENIDKKWLFGGAAALVAAYFVLKPNGLLSLPRSGYTSVGQEGELVDMTEAEVLGEAARADRDVVWGMLNKRQRKQVVALMTKPQKRQFRDGALLVTILTQDQRKAMRQFLTDDQRRTLSGEVRNAGGPRNGRRSGGGGGGGGGTQKSINPWGKKNTASGFLPRGKAMRGTIIATRELAPTNPVLVGVSGNGRLVPVRMPAWAVDGGPAAQKPARPELLRLGDGSTEEIVTYRVLRGAPPSDNAPRRGGLRPI